MRNLCGEIWVWSVAGNTEYLAKKYFNTTPPNSDENLTLPTRIFLNIHRLQYSSPKPETKTRHFSCCGQKSNSGSPPLRARAFTNRVTLRVLPLRYRFPLQSSLRGSVPIGTAILVKFALSKETGLNLLELTTYIDPYEFKHLLV